MDYRFSGRGRDWAYCTVNKTKQCPAFQQMLEHVSKIF
jgi:hypothetical protein